MGIGVSIFLIAVGLILALAVDIDLSGVNVEMIGWILVVVGIVGLLLTLLVWGPRRSARGGIVEEERRTYDDRPPA